MPAYDSNSPENKQNSNSHLIEREWILGIVRGDIESFEKLFKNFYKPVLHFIWGYVQSEEIAEELVQDLFMRVWEKRDALDPDKGLKTWLYRSARNLSIDYLRHRKVEKNWEKQVQDGYNPVSGQKYLDQTIHEKWMKEAVEKAIADLPERRRLVFIMSRYNSMSHKEIAQHLDISLNTVETQISRALKTLREKFEGMI